jgi:HAD superfamily hydrolase (TIGR01544 family)
MMAYTRRRGCMTALPLGTQSQWVDAFYEQLCESSQVVPAIYAAVAAYERAKVEPGCMLVPYMPLASAKAKTGDKRVLRTNFAAMAAHLDAAAALVQQFATNGCIVADPQATTTKLGALIQGGPSNLTVIADFDRTLTGAKSASAHQVVAGVLSEPFRDVERRLFAHYYPIEQNLNMPLSEKIPLMEEWYRANHLTMVQEYVSREMIADGVRKARDSGAFFARDGAAEFLAFLRSREVATQILSAGLKDVVEVALQELFALPPWEAPTDVNTGEPTSRDPIRVISNGMKFHPKAGWLEGFTEPLIHMYNKSQQVVDEGKGVLVNALVIGDGLGDANMSEGGASLDCALKIGYLNDPSDDGKAKYAAAFDIVLDGTQGLAPIQAIVDRVISR